MKMLIVICGPTAVGKTALAIQVAQHFLTEIISADSRQFFAEMSIGTAKPDATELKAVPHHFIGHVSVDRLYSAGDFERDALKKLEELFAKHNVVVMVGGSGLYLKAVLEGLHDMPRADMSLRAELQELFENEGIEGLQNRLRQTDADKLSSIDIMNTQRVMRAIEIAEQERRGFKPDTTSERLARPFEVIKIGLDMPREALYDRINTRVDAMVAAGLVNEAKNLEPLKHLNALQTVGYSELFEYFEGTVSFKRAIELIKQHTRNFAKRQLTWFRKEKDVHWFEPGQAPAIIALIEKAL